MLLLIFRACHQLFTASLLLESGMTDNPYPDSVNQTRAKPKRVTRVHSVTRTKRVERMNRVNRVKRG